MSIKELIREKSNKSVFCFKVYWAYHMMKLKSREHLDNETFAKRMYKANTGKDLNLENPQTFDEKLWWLKFNYRNPLAVKCSDKYLVRDYVKECGYGNILNELYGAWDRAEDVVFNTLPSPCFIKCTTGSGTNCIYDSTSHINRDLFNTIYNSKINEDYSKESREWNYKGIKGRIIAEKVLRDKYGKLPIDYKFMCFNGKPKLLFLDLCVCDEKGKHTDDYPRNIYDMDFNLMPFTEQRPNSNESIEKPENFEFMVEVARRLSKPFPHCRVDLYNIDGNVYFGEITFFHGGGCNNIQPLEWAYKMGEWIDIDSIKGTLAESGGGAERKRLVFKESYPIISNEYPLEVGGQYAA